MSPRPALFVSYASDDAAAIATVLPLLHDLGFDCWWDQRLIVGRDYHDAIQDAMRAAAGIVSLWSPAYLRDRSYALREFRFARFTLERTDIAIVLLERVSPRDLDISMTELKVPSEALAEAVPDDRIVIVAEALAAAGIRLPHGPPPSRPQRIDEEARLILPFERLEAWGGTELAQRTSRLHQILSKDPQSPFHGMNAALLWLHAGRAEVAAGLARTALGSRPDNAELSYFAALVATGAAPVVRGPRERVAAIWDLADRAAALGYGGGLPHILQAALALDYHERNGMRAPRDAHACLALAQHLPLDRGEFRRLLSVLASAAPAFHARLAG